jgi:hypothetical protein
MKQMEHQCCCWTLCKSKEKRLKTFTVTEDWETRRYHKKCWKDREMFVEYKQRSIACGRPVLWDVPN